MAQGLRRELRLGDALFVNIGTILASAIFVVPAYVIASTGSALSVPSMTNIGHIRSSTESRLSAIIRREKAFILFRRIRVAGYSPLLISAPID